MFNKKKTYFQQKLSGVQKAIWDFEFKREKIRMIREEIRQEYDNQKSRLSVLETQIKAQTENSTMEKGEIVRLDDRKVLLERDTDRFRKQMEGLDLEISGCKPSEEHRDGVQGINGQIEALRELAEMLKSYIKSI